MHSLIVPLLWAFLLILPGTAVQAQKAPAAPEDLPAALDEPESQEVQRPVFTLSNKSRREIVAVLLTGGAAAGFVRMDLGPGNEDELDNPGGTADIQMDLGLWLADWAKVPLDGVQSLTLCGEHECCLVVQPEKGEARHLQGQARSLLPREGSAPVCSLDAFRPGMTMAEACGRFPDAVTMEESVYITSLGFGNIVWSARLNANADNGTGPDAQLENVELWQKLSTQHLTAVLQTLEQQGQVPWQAAFPGMEVNFPDMLSYPQSVREELLRLGINAFLRHGRGVASISFAPQSLVQELAASGFPQSNTQIYTLSLHRDSETLCLDMTSYNGEDLSQ